MTTKTGVNQTPQLYQDPISEDDLRIALTEKLRDFGWIVYEEVWVKHIGTRYRADILAHHPEYDNLGWVLFELKRYGGSFATAITKTHKQIVYRYIGAYIDDLRYPLVKDTPKTYVYSSPYSKWDGNVSWVILRFFNRYGIGILPKDSNQIIFHPDNPHWARVHLNPKENSSWADSFRLQNYLEARVFGLK